jgi:CDP-diacylglycerol--glycerol-3-phosphate 3-phosphatidyltransferase
MDISPRHFLYPANLMSLLRLVLAVPVTYLVASPELGQDRLLIALIGLGILTDLLDGPLSRKLDQITDLGKVLDPIADKVIIVAGIVAAVFYRGFPALLVLLLAYRDILIVIGGILLTRRIGKITMANRWGKLNTFFMAFLCLSFAIDPGFLLTRLFGYAGLVMTIVSGISYFAFAESHLFQRPVTRWALRCAFVLIPIVLAALLDRFAPGLTWL